MRCAGCPALPGSPCDQARNPRRCHLAATVPIFRDKIRLGAAWQRPLPDPTPGSVQSSYPPGGIVQLWPAAYVGGAERAMLSVIRSAPALPWRGIAIPGGVMYPGLLDEARSLLPIATDVDESMAMLAGADVILCWAMSDLARWIPQGGRRPRIVAMSHSTADSPWAMGVMADDAGIDGYVAVSESARGPIPERRHGDVTVIPNAIDFGRLAIAADREATRASWGIPPGAKVLGGLNRLSAEKDPAAMVRAVAALPPEWFGVMVGEGSDRVHLGRIIAEIAPGRVILPGARLDAGNVLDAFDTILCASEYESFCLTMAEAAAFGCPIIGTKTGIAADHPILRPVPIRASGRAIASAVIADQEDRPGTLARIDAAKALASSLWHPDAIGQAWDAHLRPWLAARPTPPAKNPHMQRLDRAKSCPHRGCKTGCSHAVCNHFHREVTMSECLLCNVVHTTA